jgi:hypothetical protein
MLSGCAGHLVAGTPGRRPHKCFRWAAVAAAVVGSTLGEAAPLVRSSYPPHGPWGTAKYDSVEVHEYPGWLCGGRAVEYLSQPTVRDESCFKTGLQSNA